MTHAHRLIKILERIDHSETVSMPRLSALRAIRALGKYNKLDTLALIRAVYWCSLEEALRIYDEEIT